MNFWEDKVREVPVIQDLVKNWKQIKKEVLELISNPDILHDYPRFDKLGGMWDLYEKYWKVCPFTVFDDDYAAKFIPHLDEEQKKFFFNLIAYSKSKCPTIQKCIADLEKEGHIRNVFVSRLIPGSIIHPHHGYTDKWMRVHIGLVCDPGCKITIGNEFRTWEEGKLIAFRDGDMHSVKHEGSEERIVLSSDIRISYLEPFILSSVT